MSNYIFTKSHSIPDSLCEQIINNYENDSHNHYRGATIGGINPEIKDTTDIIIPSDKTHAVWGKISRFLYSELLKNLREYLKSVHNENFNANKNYDKEYFYFDNSPLSVREFLMQKYKKNSGKYVYHNDFYMNNNSYRVITFIWYLNDVIEGGETEFCNDCKIRPEKGKLLLFPATWTYSHRGNIPISNDKYIITGWFWLKI